VSLRFGIAALWYRCALVSLRSGCWIDLTQFISVFHRPKTIDHRPPTIDHRPKTTDQRPSTNNYQLKTLLTFFFYIWQLLSGNDSTFTGETG
jgi:hypothetical protein